MSYETDTTSEAARVLGEHYPDQTSYDAGDLHGCSCGWEVPRPRSSDTGDWEAYWAHQAAALAEAGLLREGAALDDRVPVFEDDDPEDAQIATQEPAEATQGGSGDSRAPGGLGERLRALAPAARFPSDYARIWACADEADRLEVVSNGARIKVQLDRVVALADEWDKAAERRSDLDGDLFDPTAADAYRSRAADLRDALAQEVP